jgi:prepilin-type N-terminal cleavage/methylation domain-containing protein
MSATLNGPAPPDKHRPGGKAGPTRRKGPADYRLITSWKGTRYWRRAASSVLKKASTPGGRTTAAGTQQKNNNHITSMLTQLNTKRAGFTLVEIMIVVAIIALLAAIAVPNFLRSRKRSQATQVLEDLRILDSAVDQYAIENNKASGNPDFADLQAYVKTGTRLYSSANTDILGNSFGTFTIDTPPKVPDATFTALSDVAPSSFWSPYK